MNFSLPSGFTHRECIPEYTRMFQSFLRILEYLCPPPRQASSVLQGACRLQNLSPVGSPRCMTVQRLDGRCVCDLRYSNLPATQYILTLWHALPIALIFNHRPQWMCGRQESPTWESQPPQHSISTLNTAVTTLDGDCCYAFPWKTITIIY